MSIITALQMYCRYDHNLPEHVKTAQFTAVQVKNTDWERPTITTQTIMQPENSLTHWIITTNATQYKTCTRFYTNFLRCSPEHGIQCVHNSAEAEFILSERDYSAYPPNVAVAKVIHTALREFAPHLDDVELYTIAPDTELDITDSDPTALYLYFTDQL